MNVSVTRSRLYMYESMYMSVFFANGFVNLTLGHYRTTKYPSFLITLYMVWRISILCTENLIENPDFCFYWHLVFIVPLEILQTTKSEEF